MTSVVAALYPASGPVSVEKEQVLFLCWLTQQIPWPKSPFTAHLSFSYSQSISFIRRST